MVLIEPLLAWRAAVRSAADWRGGSQIRSQEKIRPAMRGRPSRSRKSASLLDEGQGRLPAPVAPIAGLVRAAARVQRHHGYRRRVHYRGQRFSRF